MLGTEFGSPLQSVIKISPNFSESSFPSSWFGQQLEDVRLRLPNPADSLCMVMSWDQEDLILISLLGIEIKAQYLFLYQFFQ